MSEIRGTKKNLQIDGKITKPEFFVFCVEQRTYSRKGDTGIPVLMKVNRNLFTDVSSAEKYRDKKLSSYIEKYPESVKTNSFTTDDKLGLLKESKIIYSRKNVKNDNTYTIDTNFVIQRTGVFNIN